MSHDDHLTERMSAPTREKSNLPSSGSRRAQWHYRLGLRTPLATINRNLAGTLHPCRKKDGTPARIAQAWIKASYNSSRTP